MVLLDGMIRTGRFKDFIIEFIRQYNEEQEDQALWELWLHKIYDKSFIDFKRSLNKPSAEAPKREELEATVKTSFDLLASFVPESGCENNEGIVQVTGDSSD